MPKGAFFEELKGQGGGKQIRLSSLSDNNLNHVFELEMQCRAADATSTIFHLRLPSEFKF